jgi:hypothetical protein
MSRFRPFLFAWCLLAGLVFSGPAGASTFVFPGCGQTLQKCVNAAPAGSTIKLRTDQLIPIANTLTIDKGLRIVAAPGITSTPIPRSDAARRFRVHGGGVDIGSFEFGSNLPGHVEGVSRSGSDSPDAIKGTPGVDVLCGVGGNDAIQAGGGRDFVSGGTASDQLFGGGGADRLYGDLGKDHVFGEDGGDYLNVKDGVVGNDSADGGRGSDTCKTDQNDTRISC